MAAATKACAQAHYKESEKLFVAALKEAEKFGPNDGRLPVTLNQLADLYLKQGKYSLAEPLCRRSLALREKSLGPNHLLVATSLVNLAALYDTVGKYTQAEQLYKRALAIKDKELGPDRKSVV